MLFHLQYNLFHIKHCMPQLDVLSFLSQFFWFFISFWSLYIVSFRYFLVPTAMALKVREYLSLPPVDNKSSDNSVNNLSEKGASDFDNLISSYNNLLNKSSSTQISQVSNNMKNVVNSSRNTIDIKTKKVSLTYALNKSCIDFKAK
ncbi:MAG: hypothetical protein CMM86_03390 [Rhodovulum sp.]|nr:hypothetical protein [Rhodovulum sp.]